MALNIKNSEVQQLAADVARMAGETKTEAIRKALLLRTSGLQRQACTKHARVRVHSFLEHEASAVTRGVAIPTPGEQDEILGYGADGG